MQLFKLCEIDASMAFVGRGAGLGVCNAINFFLVNTASNIIRARTTGIPEATEWDPNPINNIDAHNEQMANRGSVAHNVRGESGVDDEGNDVADINDEQENRAEQGFTVPDDPVVVAGYLKVIFAELQAELIRHARKHPYESMPNRSYPDRFDIPFTLVKELERQMVQKEPDERRIANEAEILGRPIEEIRTLALRRGASRINFIRENAREIIELAANWHLTGDDAMLDHHACVERLHPMQQLRLLAGADQGLFFAVKNTIMNYQRLDIKIVKANIDMIEGKRNEVLDEVDRLMRIDSFQRQVMEAEERGQTYPAFQPRAVLHKAKTA